ncbi:serine/threonine-protein kinase [Streptomyces sp. NPDC058052]|uniref:serine/threonine-protein kinase n=1 Tax=Streptomyces sp. NPDC058052 TaxID=3346316 RepID=UPI0036E956B2
MQVRARPAHPDLTPTARVVAGRYRLDRLLGRGGAADVYEALDLRLRRAVAVKVFRPSDVRRTDVQCGQEARLLARMHHPGLVTLYDTGDDGRPYLVLQLVRGTTLRRRIARAVLTPSETCRTGAALASALAHVHACGIVHRDVKPSNILLDRADTPHLSDFGISRPYDGSSHDSPDDSADTLPDGAGTLVGTASYMAPEQALGRSAGPEADVYSLGLVLLEALKGEAEYGGTPLEAALAHLHRHPVVPTGLPGELAGLLTAMTARSPEARPGAAVCARVLADPRTAGHGSSPGPGTGSRKRAAPRVAGGPEAGAGARAATRSPGAGRPERRGARAVTATLVTLGLALTGSLGARPAGESAASPLPEPADGTRTTAPAPLAPPADDPRASS